MGILLGVQTGRVVDISNSFEVISHEEDFEWEFAETRLQQYKTAFSDLDVVGWYTVANGDVTDIHMQIHRRMMEMNESPVFMMMHPTIDPLQKDLPVFLYETEVHLIDGVSSFIFVKATYSIAAEDAERIGVDQVAKTSTASGDKGSGQLVSHMGGLYSAVKMLKDRLAAVFDLLEKMESGSIPIDRAIVREIAGLAKRVPLIEDPSFLQRFASEYNDTLLTVHLAMITKGVHAANDILEKSQYLMDRPRRKLVPIG